MKTRSKTISSVEFGRSGPARGKMMVLADRFLRREGNRERTKKDRNKRQKNDMDPEELSLKRIICI